LKTLGSFEKQDIKLSRASAIFFVGSCFNAMIKTVLPIPESMWGALSALVGLIMLFVLFSCASLVIKREKRLAIQSFLLFFLAYTLSIVIILSNNYPVMPMIRNSMFLTFAWWLPTGLCACAVNNKQILYSVWVKASYVLSVFCILIFFFHIPTTDENPMEYNMTFGSQIILPLLIQINEYKNKRRLWLLLLVLFEIATILLYANRGILLSLVFFLAYKFAFEEGSTTKRIIAIFFLAIVGVVLFSSIQTIATSIENLGFESRTISMLASGAIDDTSGRDEIWAFSFKMVSERPLLGWGLGGEYFRLAEFEQGTYLLDDVHTYTPHNGLLQNVVNFGVLIGLLIDVLIVIPLFRMYRCKEKSLRQLLIIFGSAAVVPGLVSASGFFIKPSVAIFLYLYYFSRRKRIRS